MRNHPGWRSSKLLERQALDPAINGKDIEQPSKPSLVQQMEEIDRHRQHGDKKGQFATDSRLTKAELNALANPGAKVCLVEQLGKIVRTARTEEIGNENRKDRYIPAQSKVFVRCLYAAMLKNVAHHPTPITLEPNLFEISDERGEINSLAARRSGKRVVMATTTTCDVAQMCKVGITEIVDDMLQFDKALLGLDVIEEQQDRHTRCHPLLQTLKRIRLQTTLSAKDQPSLALSQVSDLLRQTGFPNPAAPCHNQPGRRTILEQSKEVFLIRYTHIRWQGNGFKVMEPTVVREFLATEVSPKSAKVARFGQWNQPQRAYQWKPTKQDMWLMRQPIA